MQTDTNTIEVRHVADGEFVVTRGGTAYVRKPGGAGPYPVHAGDEVTASMICEWRELGCDVVEAA